jgi:hypothetical protein
VSTLRDKLVLLVAIFDAMVHLAYKETRSYILIEGQISRFLHLTSPNKGPFVLAYRLYNLDYNLIYII